MVPRYYSQNTVLYYAALEAASLASADKEHSTGKSFSEALILASINPQYDKRLFIEFPEKYKFTTCCVQILF